MMLQWGRNDVMKHVRGKHHWQKQLRHLGHYFLFKLLSPKAEKRWATFIAKHNIAFLASDHATNIISCSTKCFLTQRLPGRDSVTFMSDTTNVIKVQGLVSKN